MNGQHGRLVEAVAWLEDCLTAAVTACRRDAAALAEQIGGDPLRPEQMRDDTGRFLLLDAVAALVNGLAALPPEAPAGPGRPPAGPSGISQ